jgi:tetratricopeptide (TPR) repeat protein
VTHLLSQAVAHLEAAADLSPQNARYRLSAGEALLLAGDDLAAERHLRAAVNLGLGPRAEALWALALARVGDFAAAAAVVDEALHRHGPFAHGLYVRAVVHAGKGEAPEASFALNEAVRLAEDGDFYVEEAGRLRERGPQALAGYARPFSAPLASRFFRGSESYRRRGAGDGEAAPC